MNDADSDVFLPDGRVISMLVRFDNVLRLDNHEVRVRVGSNSGRVGITVRPEPMLVTAMGAVTPDADELFLSPRTGSPCWAWNRRPDGPDDTEPTDFLPSGHVSVWGSGCTVPREGKDGSLGHELPDSKAGADSAQPSGEALPEMDGAGAAGAAEPARLHAGACTLSRGDLGASDPPVAAERRESPAQAGRDDACGCSG